MSKNPNLPQIIRTSFSKRELLEQLFIIDNDITRRKRVLALETSLRNGINTHINALPTANANLSKFNTSPFVILIYCKHRGYNYVSQIEKDILPAKLFSSMETSAGRLIQDVVLPYFGWSIDHSTMQSPHSVIDGFKIDNDILKVASIKSGPRCLNDEMSKDIADDVVRHAETWANDADVDQIEFTYGVLYGTPKQSNKKDWHILRNITELISSRSLITPPTNRWDCHFSLRAKRIVASVKIGTAWWKYVGDDLTHIELLIALIRACVSPTNAPIPSYTYTISDLGSIVSTATIPSSYNVSLLQKSQLEWFFFIATHYCDELID